MNQFQVGGDSQYIQAAYAPSGRSTCRSCKQKIAQEQIRLSYNIEQENRYATYWYHLKCFVLKKKFMNIDPIQEIYNLDQIDGNATDMDVVVEYIEAEKARLRNGTKRPKISAKKEEKGKEEEDDDDSDQQFKGTKKEAKKSKQQAKQDKKEKILSSAYTPQQQKQFNQLVKTYSSYSADKLKQILTLNNQTKTGNKIDLVQKCADGKVLGQIPLCAKCGGGRPKFDRLTGIYKCNGYMDDTKYRNCNKTFAINEIQRVKWIDL